MPIPPSGYVYERLCEEEIHLGVPSDHPLAKKKKVTPELLGGETLLTLGQGYRLFNDAEKLANAVGATLREDYAGTSLDAIRQMVSIGMGLSLFPELYVRSEFHKEQHVVLRNINRWPMSRTICVAWRRDSLRGQHFGEIAAAAKSVAKSLDLTIPKHAREDGWETEATRRPASA